MRRSAQRSERQPPRTAGPAEPGPLEGARFDELFEQCAGDVHGYALSLLGDRASAEDVTALAFERLYRSRARLDRGRGTPRAWLFTIARNAALDELRRRKHRPLLLADVERSGGSDEALEALERRDTVRAGLAALTLREREIVLLKFHGQLTNGELARAMGISESNVGTRLHRALTRLRELCRERETQEAA